jgi:hypothetical protein
LTMPGRQHPRPTMSASAIKKRLVSTAAAVRPV